VISAASRCFGGTTPIIHSSAAFFGGTASLRSSPPSADCSKTWLAELGLNQSPRQCLTAAALFRLRRPGTGGHGASCRARQLSAQYRCRPQYLRRLAEPAWLRSCLPDRQRHSKPAMGSGIGGRSQKATLAHLVELAWRAGGITVIVFQPASQPATPMAQPCHQRIRSAGTTFRSEIVWLRASPAEPVCGAWLNNSVFELDAAQENSRWVLSSAVPPGRGKFAFSPSGKATGTPGRAVQHPPVR